MARDMRKVAGLVATAVGCSVVFSLGCDDDSTPGENKRVFVTSAAYTGDLGGLTGADEKCDDTADAAALGGTWAAWLSDSTTSAIDRIADVGPWYLVDETTLVFDDKTNLTTTPVVPISVDENGTSVSDAVTAWTGTAVGGAAGPPLCACPDSGAEDWMYAEAYCLEGEISVSAQGKVGMATSSTDAWTDAAEWTCNREAHLYCIEQ